MNKLKNTSIRSTSINWVFQSTGGKIPYKLPSLLREGSGMGQIISLIFHEHQYCKKTFQYETLYPTGISLKRQRTPKSP